MAACNACGLCPVPSRWCDRRARPCGVGNLSRTRPAAKQLGWKPQLPSSFACIDIDIDSYVDCALVEFFNLLEWRTHLISCRHNWFGVKFPRDIQRRIIPRDRSFELRRIKIGGLVEDVGGLRGDSEAMSKPARNP